MGSGRHTGSSSRSRRYSVTCSVREYQTLDPIREAVVRVAQIDIDRSDLFLCYAWDDREDTALEFYNFLNGLDVKVWFSEKNLPLGAPLMRQIDKGLNKFRTGIVLVTPAMLKNRDAE